MIDWHLTILLLRKYYGADWKIAKQVRCSGSMIKDLAGKQNEPRFSLGVRIIDLAYDVLPAEELKRIKI